MSPFAPLRPLAASLTLGLGLALAAPHTSARADGECESECEHECDCCRPAAVDVSVGLQTFSRHLRYTDDVYGYLRAYSLPAAPALATELRVFPGAVRGHGLGTAFGVGLRYDRSMGLESERASIVRYQTVHQVLQLDLLGRYRSGRTEVIGAAGVGQHRFVMRNAEPLTPDFNPVPDTPNMTYAYVDLGVDVRFQPWDRFGMRTSASYLATFSTGGMQADVWFPHSEAGGLTLGLEGFVPLTKGLELRGGFEYRRYFHALRSEAGDEVIAGGALDQYTALELSLAYRR